MNTQIATVAALAAAAGLSVFLSGTALAGGTLIEPTSGPGMAGAEAKIDPTAPRLDLRVIDPQPGELEPEHSRDTVLVQFRPELGRAAYAAAADLVAGSVRHEFTLVPGLVSMNIGMEVADALAALRQRASDDILYVEPDYLWRPSAAPNDSSYNLLYGMNNNGQTGGTPGADINAETAWDFITGDQDFVIAVIDGGTNPNHPDLVDNIWTNPDEIPNNGVDDDNNGYIDDVNGWDFYNDDKDTNNDAFHGTHVSGTVGARGNNGQGVAGVMWRCRIMPLKFIGPEVGSTTDAIRAIQYAVNKGVKVSNNSWGGGGFSSSLENAIEASKSVGHIFVAASGNDGQPQASYPARYSNSNIISVAATDDEDNLAGFSNYNAVSVDLGAPGVNTYSLNSGTGYSYASGTSMASPHVAGAVALLYAYTGNWTWTEVRQHILDTVRPVSSLAGTTATGGVLDIGEAISTATSGLRIVESQLAPESILPGEATPLSVSIPTGDEDLVPGSAQLLYRFDGGAYQSISMDAAGGDVYSVSLPAPFCGDDPEYYFSAEGSESGVVTLPALGANAPFAALVGEIDVVVQDTVRFNFPWTVENSSGLTAGAWEAATPIAGCDRGNPSIAVIEDRCYVTQADPNDCNSDVDGGSTTLSSFVMDATDPKTIVSYYRWYNNVEGDNPEADVFVVEVSDDDGATWEPLETVGPSGPEVQGGWIYKEWLVADIPNIENTNEFRIRFTASDLGSPSIVEAAVDWIRLTVYDCEDPSETPGDLNGDGVVNAEDLFIMLGDWGDCSGCPSDLDDSGSVDAEDLFALLGSWS